MAMLLGMSKRALTRWVHRRQQTEPSPPRQGRPPVVSPAVRDKIRRCYLDSHRVWGPQVLAAWAARHGLGSYSPTTVGEVIKDLKLPEPPRPKPKRYEVTAADVMWSEDGAGFRQQGKKHELLVVQDECARYKVNHRLVAGPANAADVCDYLRQAFEAHGAPLVLKHDNGAIFVADEVKELLDEYGVVELTGPKYYPCYNGKKERSIRDIKSYERAMRRDLPSGTLQSRVDAAIEDLNDHRPRPVLSGHTAYEVYRQQRRNLPNRQRFRQDVDRREQQLTREATTRAEMDCARRKAVEQVLIRYGLLNYGAGLSPYFEAKTGTK
jgi:transposase InsO family protein